MDKEEKKKINKELEQKQLELEKEFHKTIFGKFMKVIVIMAMIAIAVGLIIGVFEAIVYAKNLDINKYQTIISLGDICFECGGKSVFYGMLFYACVLPALMKDKEKKNQLNKKSKINSATLVLVLFVLCMVGPILKLASEVCTLLW